jgi:hypothetical protein
MTNKTIEEIAESLPPLAEATTAGIAQHLYYYMKGNGMLKNLTPEERTSALEFVKSKVTESHSLGKSEGKREAREELKGELEKRKEELLTHRDEASLLRNTAAFNKYTEVNAALSLIDNKLKEI